MSLTTKISLAVLRNARRLNGKLILSDSIWETLVAFCTVHSPYLDQVIVSVEFIPAFSVSNQWVLAHPG